MALQQVVAGEKRKKPSKLEKFALATQLFGGVAGGAADIKNLVDGGKGGGLLSMFKKGSK